VEYEKTMALRHNLSQKTLVPKKQPNTIRRSHLLELLYQGLQQKVSIVTAPAGSGKTTLVTDFAAEVDIQVCWYTLNARDLDMGSLLDGIIAAFSQRFPQIGRLVTPILESSLQPEKQPNKIIDTLVDEIRLNIPEYILIIIEDLHIIEECTSDGEIISQLIEMSPENCHFIITSRNPVTLPVLSKLGIKHQVNRITAPQLALSVSEIKELFSTQFSTVLSQEQAENILEETKGWVPALLLHGTASNVSFDKTTGHLSRQDLYAYLTEEVFQSQPERIQEFLSNTAILDNLFPELCDTFLDIHNSASILEDLSTKNLFITRLEGEHYNYRYNTFLREFLLHQLETKNPEQLIMLHYKAGLVFEKEQQWDESIHHFIKARKPSEVSRIILSIGEEYVRGGKWGTVIKWLEVLPKAQVETSVELLLIKASALVHLGDSNEAARILTELLDRKAYGNNSLLQAKILNWRCAALRMMGKFGEAKQDIKKAITILNLIDGPSEIKGDVFRRLGDICVEQGQFKGALRYQKAALKCYDESHDLSLTSQVHNSLGIIYKSYGDFGQALYHFENAREGWQKTGNYNALSATLNNIGVIYQIKGQYEMALDTLKSGLEASNKHGYRRTEACLLLTTGEVLRDAGQYKDALLSFQNGLDISREVMEPYFITYALLGLGEVERLLGNSDKATTLINEALIHAKNHGQPYESALIKIQIALIENENGNFDTASRILEESRRYLSQAGDKIALAKVYFYLAHNAFLSKKYDKINPNIIKLEEIIKEIGFTEFLVPECKHAILLLQFCVNKKIGVTIFPQILEKIKRNSSQKTPLTSPVSETSVDNSSTTMTVTSFGEIKVLVNEREVKEEEWRSVRAKEIFIYLLSNASGLTREQVTAALWPDLSPARGTSNFHINLYRARQAIIPVIFSQDGGKYRINPEINISFDLFQFRGLICISKTLSGSEKADCLEKATALYKGQFAQEIYGDWAERIRQSAESEYIKALLLLADIYSQQHNDQKAITTLECLINCDPYNDEAYARIMQLQIDNKDRVAAQRTYQLYCQNVVPETNSISPQVSRIYQKLTNISQ
jgi:ATP/maltotriose-dependent transcriptional regulator MalT/DNA-binding SARP family transcriptional activator